MLSDLSQSHEALFIIGMLKGRKNGMDICSKGMPTKEAITKSSTRCIFADINAISKHVG